MQTAPGSPGTPSAQVLQGILSRFPSGHDLEKVEAQALLHESLVALESAMATVCCKYSRMPLLLMLRAEVPPQLFLAGAEFPSVEAHPLKILAAAALKHGADDRDAIPDRLPRVADLRLTEEQFKDVRDVAELSWRYARFVGFAKAVGSGAALNIKDGRVYYSIDEQLERLPSLENRRMEQNQSNLLSPVGAISPFSEDVEQQVAHMSSAVLVVHPTYDPARPRENRPPVMWLPEFHGSAPLLVNYAFRLYDLTDFVQLARSYAADAPEQQILSPDDLVLCLRGLTQNRLTANIRSTERAQFFCLTGVGCHDPDRLAAWLEGWITNASGIGTDIEQSRALVRRFLDATTLTASELAHLDLRFCRIPSFIYRLGPLIVVDWVSLPLFLVNRLDALSSRPEMANLKGAQYEANLNTWLQSKVPGLMGLFEPNKKLRVDGKLSGEIDLAFRAGDVGFIVDCKAYAVSTALAYGDEAALTMRWEHTEDWLSQVIRVSKFLAAHPAGDNYVVPREICRLVPLVCSPHVEPIFDFDDKHALTETQPRICTPFELAGILRGDASAYIDSNQYTFAVDHG